MSYVSPNFEVNTDQDSAIITPTVDEDGDIDGYLVGERIKKGSSPIIVEEPIETQKMLLTPVGDNESMWLYPNGEIKTER